MTEGSILVRIVTIISIILCLIGAYFAFLFFITIWNNPDDGFWEISYYSIAIVLGILTIIGAISELKYQRGGTLLCLIIGIVMLFSSFIMPVHGVVGNRAIGSYFYGISFTLIGSLVGVVGLLIKKKSI